ncbi:unnamed protein product [Acanthoscelides obtectus]|uniref:Uncharacterized protein n=1 Tax=Acanthoscelides obtectus TaxID=200917 RepID=A0A9P0K6P7_ACAOB|nr:unnamed protein product [Acanthoscelides obtectus]CAK1633287.1 hypothetical protein AOBTE_LOCUS8016 [Acanthoscelides obtectus]
MSTCKLGCMCTSNMMAHLSHYHNRVRNYLDTWSNNRWIGRDGPISWPPRSPDMTPMDFFLWSYVKQEVYRYPPSTSENMKERIKDDFLNIREHMLREVQRSFIQRLRLCIQHGGDIFEQFL